MRKTVGWMLAVSWLAILGIGALFAPWIFPDPLATDLSSSIFPVSLGHPAGTDELGRDVLSRLFHAARATLAVTIGATLLDILLATALGLIAGYRGGWSDRALLLAIDLFWTVPFVVFVVLIISFIGVTTISLIVAIAAINWVTAARVVRTETARLRQEPFVRSAEAFGFSPQQIVLHQIVPALSKTIAALAAYTAIEVLTLETGLAFIGLSLPAPAPTWGGMLGDGLNYMSSASWLVFLPAAAVTLTLVSLQSLGRQFEHGRQSETDY